MTRSLKPKLTLAQQVIDLTALGIAFWIAAALASPGSVTVVGHAVMARESHVFASLLILLLSWSACLSTLWLSRSEPTITWQDELIEVIKAVSLCMLILSAAELILEWQTVNKWVLLIFWGMASALLFAARLINRLAVRQFGTKAKDIRRVVIVGTGIRGQQTAEMLNQRQELGYRLVGFIDDVAGAGVIGGLDQMEEILAANVVDEMIITLPIKTFYEKMENIIRVATEQGITVRVHSNLFSIQSGQAVAEQVGGTPMVSLYTGPRFSLGFLLKEIMDFVGALGLLILLAPAMIAVSILIKLTSPGPIIFSQERIGYNKRPFRMYKFRTMVADAESKQQALEQLNEASGPVFKIRNDPRVTPLGRFLRKTSLDELPQLFNVIKGDLSLVGPRPLPRRDFERFDEYWFNRRFSIKPGLTCIWQVSGRNETDFDAWIKQDLEYIDRWSLGLDILILCKTIPAVLRGTGM